MPPPRPHHLSLAEEHFDYKGFKREEFLENYGRPTYVNMWEVIIEKS